MLDQSSSHSQWRVTPTRRSTRRPRDVVGGRNEPLAVSTLAHAKVLRRVVEKPGREFRLAVGSDFAVQVMSLDMAAPLRD